MSSRRRSRRSFASDSDWSHDSPKSKSPRASVSPDSRRRSSRVRKRPDSYVPPNASPTGNSKRKRPAPKKTMKKVSPVKSSRRRKSDEVFSKTSSSDSDSDEDNDEDERPYMFSLFKDVNSDAALAQSVRDWIAEYKFSQEKSMRKILGLILYSCVGDEKDLDGIVDEVVSTDFEIDDLSDKLCDLDPKCFYPILEAGKSKSQYRNFQGRLHEFWQRLVAACHADGLLYDSQILEMCIDWLTAISGLQVPSFRHTCMDSAFHICKLLIKHCDKLQKNLKIDRDRLNTAMRQKSKGKRIETLEANITKFRTELDVLEEHIETVVTGIFVHRQKDVHYTIRAAAIEGLSNFVCEYPSYFLDEDNDRDTCINWSKYLGQHLHDEHASVRLQAVRGAKKLLMSQKDASALEMYLDRNQERIVSMCQDVDTNVTIDVLELCGEILEKDEDRLSKDEIDRLDRIIFRDTLKLQRAAAKFIRRRITDLNVSSKSAKLQLKALASFCSNLAEDDSCNSLDFCDFVVAGFFDTTESLREWGIMSELILKDTKGKSKLSDQEQAVLVRFLLKSMNIVTEKMSNKRTSKRNKAIFAESQKHFSDCMVTKLPKLLEKYSAEDSIVQSLILMPQLMAVDSFNPASNKKKLKNLLEMTVAIYKRGTSKIFLEVAAKSLQHLCTAEHDRQDECVAAVDQLAQDVGSELVGLIDDDTGDHDTEENLRIWLLRLFILGTKFDLQDKLSVATNLFDFAMERSCFISFSKGCDPQVTTSASNFFWTQLVTRIQSLTAAVDPEDEYESQDAYDKTIALELERLLDRLEPYLKLATHSLAVEIPKDTPDEDLDYTTEALNTVKLSLATNLIELRYLTLKVSEARGVQKLKDAIWTDDPSLENQLASALSVAIVNARPEDDEEGKPSLRAQIACPLAQLLAKKMKCKLLPVFLGFLGAFKDLDAEELGKIVAKAAFKGTDDDLEVYFAAQKKVLRRLFEKTTDLDDRAEQDESFLDLLHVAKSCATMGIPIFKKLPAKVTAQLLQLIEFGVTFAFDDAPNNLAFLDAIEYHTKWFKTRTQKAELAEIVHALVKKFQMEEKYAAADEHADDDPWPVYESFLYGEDENGKGGIFSGTKYDLRTAKKSSSPTSAASAAASPIYSTASPTSAASARAKKIHVSAPKITNDNKKSKSRSSQWTPSTTLNDSSSDDDFVHPDDTLDLELGDIGTEEQAQFVSASSSSTTTKQRRPSKRRRNSLRTPDPSPGQWIVKKKKTGRK